MTIKSVPISRLIITRPVDQAVGILIAVVLTAAIFAALGAPLAFSEHVIQNLPPLVIEATDHFTWLNYHQLDPRVVQETKLKIKHDAPAYVLVGNTTITWVVTHDAGGYTVYKQTVVVQDTFPPVFSTYAPTNVEAISRSGAAIPVHFDLPEATDKTDIDVTVTSSHAPGSEFPLGDTVVTFTATDDSGNAAIRNMTVTVRDWKMSNFQLDSTHNVVRASWDPLGDYAPYIVTLTESGSDKVLQTASISTASHTFGGLEADTKYVVSASTEDESAGVEKTIFTLSVPLRGPEDTMQPIITAPGDVTREATAPLTGLYLGAITATDDTDRLPVVSSDAPVRFLVGTTVVTWTATDDSGNTATDTQTVTVTDTTPPVLSNLPLSRTVTTQLQNWLNKDMAGWLGMPVATDIADPNVHVSIHPGSTIRFNLGSTNVTYTATDNSGNTASHSIVITVVRVPIAKFAPVSDDFESPDRWVLHVFQPDRYGIEVDGEIGNPAPSLKIYSLDQYKGVSRLWKAFDVTDVNDDLYLQMDVKVSSEDVILPDGTVVRQARDPYLYVHTSEQSTLYRHIFKSSNSTDAEWERHGATFTVPNDVDAIAISLYMYDYDSDHHFKQVVHVDNVYLNTTTPGAFRGGSVGQQESLEDLSWQWPGGDPFDVAEVIGPERRTG